MKISSSSHQHTESEPPEPNPFTDEEFQVWRGFLRTHRAITDELNRRLSRKHDLTLLHYGVLITLITEPGRQMRMTDIADRVLTSPSGMTRAVARLEADGLVSREQDEGDRRSFLVMLTPQGVRRLREAQVTHHACVRELLFGRLTAGELRGLAALDERPA